MTFGFVFRCLQDLPLNIFEKPGKTSNKPKWLLYKTSMQKQTVAAQNQTFQNSEPQILNLIAAIVVEPLKELWSNYWGPNPVTRYKKKQQVAPH